MVLPARWRTEPNGMNGSFGSIPVSSWNSRRAASSGSSSGSSTPLGIVHAPASRSFQNGPPGWARKSSSPACDRRYNSRPALTFGRFAMHSPWLGRNRTPPWARFLRKLPRKHTTNQPVVKLGNEPRRETQGGAMRWTRGGSTRNVEDRRGQRMGMGGGLGLGGGVIGLILALIFGGDILGGGGGDGTGATAT